MMERLSPYRYCCWSGSTHHKMAVVMHLTAADARSTRPPPSCLFDYAASLLARLSVCLGVSYVRKRFLPSVATPHRESLSRNNLADPADQPWHRLGEVRPRRAPFVLSLLFAFFIAKVTATVSRDFGLSFLIQS